MQNFKTIYAPILKLAIPIMFIQLCQASLGLVDTIIAGQFHYQGLAGVGLGSNIWTPIVILFTGILYALIPKFSAAASNQDVEQIHTLLKQGRKNANLLALIGFIAVQGFAFSCPLFIDDAQVAAITKQYLHFIAFGLPGLIHMVLYRFLSEGNSELQPVVLTGVTLLLVNTFLNYVFVNGLFNFPQLGGAGCGLATALSIYIALLMIQFLTTRSLPSVFTAKPAVFKNEDCKALLLEGLPVGIALVLEVLALTALAFFASKLGTKVIAAHQVAISIAMVVFMIPVALSSAVTIRVAHCQGLQKPLITMKTGLAALKLASVYGLFMSGMIFLFSHHIVGLFSQDTEVIAIISGLVVYIAVFQLVDSVQIVAAGILRGLEEFIKPLIAVLFTYWVVVIPLSYLVGVKGWWVDQPSIETIWMLLSLGLTMAALVLGVQAYLQLSERLKAPSADPEQVG